MRPIVNISRSKRKWRSNLTMELEHALAKNNIFQYIFFLSFFLTQSISETIIIYITVRKKIILAAYVHRFYKIPPSAFKVKYRKAGPKNRSFKTWNNRNKMA